MEESILLDIEATDVFSVSEIAQKLKKTVEQSYNNIRIRGEISGLKRHTSGHLYYALKDQDAVLDAVSWRGSLSESTVRLEDGLEIIASGRLTTYPGRSKYQMIVTHFEAAGLGALLKQLEERKQRLAAEGLFSADRKRPLPAYPRTIGVVTSPTGAVIRDILHRLEDRFPCHVLVWPVLVQGPGAADQIANAINGFNTLINNRPDVLIVARGGGSLEDLWAFNEEVVVRAAANSRIPLISAVGHETDTTLIDFASDQRAPTPTAAAEIAVPVLQDIWRYLQDRQQRLSDVMRHRVDTNYRDLTALTRGLPDPMRLLEEKSQRLDDWQERLQRSVAQDCDVRLASLMHLSGRLRSPAFLISAVGDQLTSLHRLLENCFQQKMSQTQTTYDQLAGRLEQASYHRQLSRGFCHITNAEGTPITQAKGAKQHDLWSVHFEDGNVSVMVADKVKAPRPKRQDALPDPRQPTLF